MRINVPICAAVDDCITNNPSTIIAIVNQLKLSADFNFYLNQQINIVAPPGQSNKYGPWPTSGDADAICNAATYIVSQIRKLIEDIYDDLETLTIPEILESILGILGWRASIVYQLIGLLDTTDKTALLSQFDSASGDLICALIDAQLAQGPVLQWVADTFSSSVVLRDALTYAIGGTLEAGQWSLWIAVGALIDAPDCGCTPPPADCDDITAGMGAWVFLDPVYGIFYPGEGAGRGTEPSRIGMMTQFTGQTVTSFTVYTNEPITGLTAGVFPGYNSFGSESFTSPDVMSFTFSGSWSSGVAWELIGFPALSPTLRVVQICYTFA